MIYRKDLQEVVQELKRRNLYLFDLWGYVPGSGPGGYWQQFVVPQKAFDIFEKELGDHWFGMDNGEQVNNMVCRGLEMPQYGTDGGGKIIKRKFSFVPPSFNISTV